MLELQKVVELVRLMNWGAIVSAELIIFPLFRWLIFDTVLILSLEPTELHESIHCHLLKLWPSFLANDLAKPPLVGVVRMLVDWKAVVTFHLVLRSLILNLFLRAFALHKLEYNLVFKDFVVWELLQSIKVIDTLPMPFEALCVCDNWVPNVLSISDLPICLWLVQSNFPDKELHLPLNSTYKVFTEIHSSLNYFLKLSHDPVSHVQNNVL